MDDHLRQLRETLCRELVRGEREALVVPRHVWPSVSELRHRLFDRISEAAAVLHGSREEGVRLLHDVAVRYGDAELLRWCENAVADRGSAIDRVEGAAGWLTE